MTGKSARWEQVRQAVESGELAKARDEAGLTIELSIDTTLPSHAIFLTVPTLAVADAVEAKREEAS